MHPPRLRAGEGCEDCNRTRNLDRLTHTARMEEEPDMEGTPDIATVFDDHVAAEFVDRDLDAAMATMAPDPYVFHIPSMTGGDGYEAVRTFYGTHFIGK